MTMNVTTCDNPEIWENWLKQHISTNAFAASFAWGDILAKDGGVVERLMVVEDDQILALAQIVYKPLVFGWKYAFCPMGPIAINQSAEAKIADYLAKKVSFLRLEGNWIGGGLERTIDVNPHATLILDLSQEESCILANMHPKTRYNIRVAERKGVTVEMKKDQNILLNLLRATGKRDGFRLHEAAHYTNVLNSAITSQFNAVENGQIVATAVSVAFGDTFTYLYGASDYQYRASMAPVLLQWHMIQHAKKQGYKKYDFFGIAPLKKSEDGESIYDAKHQYGGVTRFKLGFGGEYVETPGTRDLIFNRKQYNIYRLLRRIRRLF